MRASSLANRLAAFAGALAIASSCAGNAAPTTTVLEAPPPDLADTEAASVQDLCTGTELRRWELVDAAGEALATTQGVCRPASPDAPGPYVAVSQLLSDARARYELRVWLDPKGQPVEAQLREPSSTRYYSWTGDALVETHLGDVRAHAKGPATSPTWVVPSHALFMRELMVRLGVGQQFSKDQAPAHLHQRTFTPDRDRLAELQLRPVRASVATLQGQMNSEAEELPARLPLGEGHFTFSGGAGMTEALRTLHLDAFVSAGGQLVYRSVAAPDALDELLPEVPKPSYRLAADLEVRDAPVPAAGEAPALGAELVMAKDGATAARPGLLFISGAGAQDRHGIVPGSGVDVGSHEIHDGLARAGFAVLRYDERGVGATLIGADATPGFLDSVEDARRALRTLAARPEVDPARIVVIGHGEGALVATLLAQDKFKVSRKRYPLAAAVLLAAPGRNIRELVYDEIRRSLRDRDAFTQNAALEEAKKIHAAALADKELPANAEPLREWMQQIFALEPAAELAKVRIPVLALHGDKDFQVDPTSDFEPVRDALAGPRASKANQAQRVPGLDHLFKSEPGESHPGHYRDLARHVDPALVQRISTWLASVIS